MPDTSISQTPNPAVLRFRGQDLDAMTALQMRAIGELRRMTNLLLDSTEEITRRQAEFLKSGVAQMNAALECEEGGADLRTTFAQQTEAYRDLFDALAAHLGDLAEISARCCAGMIHDSPGTIADLTPQTPPKEPKSRGRGGLEKALPVKKSPAARGVPTPR